MTAIGEIDPQSLRPREVYALLTSIVTPRPIAWVSTQNNQGIGNLAPFSYFQALCSNPATIMISVGQKRDGSRKDTLANILDNGQFVVNHVQKSQGAAMQATAAEIDQSEWQHANIEACPSLKVSPPRVKHSLAALECKMTHAIPLGQGPRGMPSSTVIFGEVLHMYISPELVAHDEQGRKAPLCAQSLDSLGRLSGQLYCASDKPFPVGEP